MAKNKAEQVVTPYEVRAAEGEATIDYEKLIQSKNPRGKREGGREGGREKFMAQVGSRELHTRLIKEPF